MLSLRNKNKSKYEKTRKEIQEQFNENMFKYKGFQNASAFSRKTFNSLIKDAIASENLTNTEIKKACQQKQNENEKKEIRAFLLSFLFVFVNWETVKPLGPGDIAGEEYFKFSEGLQSEMTRLFNDLTNASFASSVFLLPVLFSLSSHTSPSQLRLSKDVLPPTISEFERKRYQDFWTEYNNHKEKITFLCTKKVEPCTEQDFYLYLNHQYIDNDPNKVRQADLLSAPCQDISLAKQFKFRKNVI